VAGVIKHIPGHGRAGVDSHKALPTVTASAEELETDLAPFRSLNDSLIGMTAHVRYTAWDDANPATLSSTVIRDVIRTRIGFGGLLLTDDLDMQALGGAVPDRAARAQAAGCDIALNCWAKMDDMVGIASALAPMSAETAARLERALAATGDFSVPADLARQAERTETRDRLLALAA
jgi:beta-N-acetylhexosaminidase